MNIHAALGAQAMVRSTVLHNILCRPGRPYRRRHHWPRRDLNIRHQRLGARPNIVTCYALDQPGFSGRVGCARALACLPGFASGLTRGTPCSGHGEAC